MRKRAINQLLVADLPQVRRQTDMAKPRQSTMHGSSMYANEETYQIPLYCDNVNRATKTLIHYVLFDRDVFGEFYADPSQLKQLLETLYMPLMEDYFGAYAESINEIDPKAWTTRAVWMQTVRGRGLTIFTDYMTSLHQIYSTLSDILGLTEQREAATIMEQDDAFGGVEEDSIEKWYNRQCSKVNLNPLKVLVRDQFKKICLLDNEDQLRMPSEASSSGEKPPNRPVLLRKLCLHLAALLPLCCQKHSYTAPLKKHELSPNVSVSTQRITSSKLVLAARAVQDEKLLRDVIQTQVSATLKQLFWRARDTINAVGDTLLTTDLLYFNYGFVRLRATFGKRETYKLKWIEPHMAEIEAILRLTSELYVQQTLKEFDTIFTCYESRNFEFPKKYFTVSIPSPMMRLFNKKLVNCRTELSNHTDRHYFIIYTDIFYHCFIRLFAIYEQASASANRQVMLRRDLELLALLGRTHLDLFDQMKRYSQSQMILSRIYSLEKRIVIQFAPISLLNPMIKSLPGKFGAF